MEPAHNLIFNQVKAGLGYIDPDQISHKITEVSKDTKYFQKQKERSKLIDQQIDDLKLKLQFANKEDLRLAKIQVDSFINSLEKKRDLNQVIFHADLDAFFANVEVLNDPSLKGIPFAVGGSIKHGVISTSSYEARKFGVRSGMAVFIALSLCPQLRIVNASGRYAEFSELVQSEFTYYDPNYISFGLDEASMNMTEYLQKTQQTAVEVAHEIQEKIFNKTQLTISIGIGPTNQLAKIASDINKPNGVFEVPYDIDGLMDFIRSLFVRKIPGVGGVTERKLQELNFNTMGDILDRREEVWFLFSQKFCKFIFSSALGIQQTNISHDDRKSYSKEETFEVTDDLLILMEKVERMGEKLALKLQRESLRCKTVTVKFKTQNFQNITHAFTFKQDTSKISDITGAAVKILIEMHQRERYKLRLIGVRVSNFLYPGQKVQKSIRDCFSRAKKSFSMNQSNTFKSSTMTEADEWEQDQSDNEEITQNEPFDNSIKSNFQEGYDDDENDFNSESEDQNTAETYEVENSKSDSFRNSIKKYFKKGNYQTPHEFIDDQETEEKKIIDHSMINYYFEKGSIEDDMIAEKNRIQSLEDKKKKQQLINSSIKKYFNNFDMRSKPSYNSEHNSDELDNDNECKSDYHFQCNNSIEKSSDYDEEDFNSKDVKFLALRRTSPKKKKSTKNNRDKKKINIVKNLIEKYYPENLWQSEMKKEKQLPRSITNSSSLKKKKTKEGTFQIGSFFNNMTPTTE